MKPKSERDCPFCQTDHLGTSKALPLLPVPWPQINGRGGRKKHIATAGFFYPNPNCAYFGVTDERVHALVGDGLHGKTEPIQDYYCQACYMKSTARRHTVLYRLKTPSSVVEKILWL